MINATRRNKLGLVAAYHREQLKLVVGGMRAQRSSSSERKKLHEMQLHPVARIDAEPLRNC